MTGRRRRGWAVGIVLALASASGAMAQETRAWVEEGEIGAPQYFGVLVGDADASATWYARVFDLRAAGDSEAEDGSWKIVNLRNDRLFVEVIRDDRAGRADRVLGVRKVGFHVPDVRVVADRIEREGGERPRVLDFPDFGVRIVQVRDPDGTIIQLSSDLPRDVGDRER